MKNRLYRLAITLVIAGATVSSLTAQETADSTPESVAVPIAEATIDTARLDTVYGARVESAASYTISTPATGFIIDLSIDMGQLVARDERIAGVHRQRPGEQYRPVTVESPFAGQVREILVTEGQYVTEGQAIARITDVQRLRVHALVSDRDVSDLFLGMDVPFEVTSSQTRLSAPITAIFPPTNVYQGLYIVELAPIPPSIRLGSYIELTLGTRPFEGVLVPREAVTTRASEPYLIVVDNGVAQRRTVTVGTIYGERIAITSGLTAGERYIPEQIDGVRDGTLVTEREARG